MFIYFTPDFVETIDFDHLFGLMVHHEMIDLFLLAALINIQHREVDVKLRLIRTDQHL